MPAAVVLPLWLLIGWGIFNAGGWAFLWVLFIAIPSVFLGQIALAMLVRARPSVREQGAVSWRDVIGFTLWHGLTIAVGCYPQSWFAVLLIAAVLVGVGLFVSTFRQLWGEARVATEPSIRVTTPGWSNPIQEERAAEQPRRSAEPHDVFVIREAPHSEP